MSKNFRYTAKSKPLKSKELFSSCIINSSCACAAPSWSQPLGNSIFCLEGQIPGGKDTSAVNYPAVGTIRRAYAPVSSINTIAGLIYCISRQYSTHRFIFGLFLKLRKSIFRKKDLWCVDEAFKHFLVQRHNKFCCINRQCIFWVKYCDLNFNCMTQNYLENGELYCSTA